MRCFKNLENGPFRIIVCDDLNEILLLTFCSFYLRIIYSKIKDMNVQINMEYITAYDRKMINN